MEIWIVRHADPDYENDSITEKGEREAKLLAERLLKQNFAAVYCSPMGRAQKTRHII
jgi:probable phosphoglycerate mutase